MLSALFLLTCLRQTASNDGDFASPDDAEAFGAAAMGLDRDEYYWILCGLADELGHDGNNPNHGGGADADEG